MKKYIRSAEEDTVVTVEDRLNDLIPTLKDNFNFAVDGIEKLATDGDAKLALEQATALNNMIDSLIGEIAEDIAQD